MSLSQFLSRTHKVWYLALMPKDLMFPYLSPSFMVGKWGSLLLIKPQCSWFSLSLCLNIILEQQQQKEK